MSKKPLIDESAKTLAERYNQHFSTLNLMEANKHKASAEVVAQSYQTLAKGFKVDLACGDADAAPLIAYLQGNGFGCEKNILKAAEWVAIGAELGNRDCQRLKTDVNPDHYSDTRMHSLCLALLRDGTPEQIFSPGVLGSGVQYAQAIRENIATYNTTTAVLQSPQVIECIKHFENIPGLYVYNEHSKSFPDGYGCCGWLEAICCCCCLMGSHSNDDHTDS